MILIISKRERERDKERQRYKKGETTWEEIEMWRKEKLDMK